ncbi:RNA-directed DNA polymerase, eukaryota, reverse transcriptase zinc-binding domain protein [Tanacetum coccineum]|uniref:RNA-directed DNA polymerase, eukaryota, reverse transcriptase zinc-binding domain protein n=1 Tax=Tanacetum coccineum TaxID=301880 RepID=A0ABQ4WJ86_9ASTR
MFNVPLKAWSKKGISTLASRLGRPIMMDQVTTDMCFRGTGWLGYARVLVEIKANKGFIENIEINYVDDQKKIKSSKWVKVEYSWRPVMCSHCKVFGHSYNKCMVRPRTEDEIVKQKASNNNEKNETGNDGFAEVRKRKNKNAMPGSNADNKKEGFQGLKHDHRYVGSKFMFVPKVHNKQGEDRTQKGKEKLKVNDEVNNGGTSKVKKWNIGKSNMSELRKSANKYAVLSDESDDHNESNRDTMIDKRLIMDEFIKKKKQPSAEESKKWTCDMINYFKCAWKAIELREEDNSEEEDVYENDDPAIKNVIANEIIGDRGMSNEFKQKELKKFIVVEKLQLIAVLETHLKNKNIAKVCDKVFGNWSWVSNVAMSPTSCRIVLGWNAQAVKVMVIHSSKQAMFCLVETILDKIKTYVSIIYASNNGIERREVWDYLLLSKRSVNDKPWVILGDFNVTLKPKEHSNGGSGISTDMQEFNDAVNALEIEDLCSSGFHFTRTKSLKNPLNAILKKLDRILVNEGFIQKFGSAHGVFLPYLISDHSPSLLIFPNGFPKKHGNLFERAKSLKLVLQEAQNDVDNDPCNVVKRKKAINILEEYTAVASDELKLLHQKAKIDWLKDGDKNTAYFHNMLKARKHKNRVESICDESGNRYWGADMAKQFVKHFQNFLGDSSPTCSLDQLGDIVNLKLSTEDAEAMIVEVTDNEIKDAVFDIDSSKSSGHDGYTSYFFKKAWGIIRKEVFLAIKEFFRNGKLLGEINATLIALVLKIDTPNKISEFRPIACCNVLYKCISKIIANRIKLGLNKIVSINQSAFIPGRHIQDNILLSQELLRGYDRKQGAKRCAMKIDIQKAYDTVNWQFLKDILIKVGFHEGEEADNRFKYHHGCKELRLTHLCFADDLLMLCNGDAGSLKVIKKSLDEFSKFPMKYIGVPLLAKSLSVKDCRKLINNVESRIKCWKNKLLSYAGRIQLIASLLSTMQSYWASVYMIPKTVMYELEKLLRRFMWNSGESAKGKAKVAWSTMCKPKDQRGLGFKSLHKWNEVLLVSQLWKIIDRKESLWVKWVNTVKLKSTSIGEIESSNSDSWGWKNMFLIRDKIKPFVRYRIRNGRDTSMWHDKWYNIGPLDRFISNRDVYNARLDNEARVANLIQDGVWKWPKEWIELFPELQQSPIPCLDIQKKDTVWWVNLDQEETSFHPLAYYTGETYDLRQNNEVEEWCDFEILLCLCCEDSHENLFFQCSYSSKIWDKLQVKGMLKGSSNSLQMVVHNIAAKPFKNSIKGVLQRLMVSAVVYHVWKERNLRIFQNEVKTVEVLSTCIEKNVEGMLRSLKVKKSSIVLDVAKMWGLQWKNNNLVNIN